MAAPEGLGPEIALRPIPQRVWGGLAVANFACGGAGAGAALGILAAALAAPVPERAIRVVEVVALGLVAAGLAAVGAEAGRPLRGINVFRHLRRSWMSREALAAAAFGALVGLDVLVPGPWQRSLGAAAALAFMLSQGFILLATRGVPAWATWEIPVLFVTAGLGKGLGAVLVVLAAVGGGEAQAEVAGLAIGVLLVDLMAWISYAGSPEGPPAKQEGLARLRTRWITAAVVGVGHLLPLGTLVVILWAGGPEPATPGWAFALAGVCMLAGGAVLKWAVVMRAGLLHPVSLHVLRPSRQAGDGPRLTVAAGARRAAGPPAR